MNDDSKKRVQFPRYGQHKCYVLQELQEARNIRGIVIDYFPFISYINTQKKGKIMTKEELEYYKHKIETYGEKYE